jgi:hypothetical protein
MCSGFTKTIVLSVIIFSGPYACIKISQYLSKDTPKWIINLIILVFFIFLPVYVVGWFLETWCGMQGIGW